MTALILHLQGLSGVNHYCLWICRAECGVVSFVWNDGSVRFGWVGAVWVYKLVSHLLMLVGYVYIYWGWRWIWKWDGGKFILAMGLTFAKGCLMIHAYFDVGVSLVWGGIIVYPFYRLLKPSASVGVIMICGSTALLEFKGLLGKLYSYSFFIGLIGDGGGGVAILGIYVMFFGWWFGVWLESFEFVGLNMFFVCYWLYCIVLYCYCLLWIFYVFGRETMSRDVEEFLVNHSESSCQRQRICLVRNGLVIYPTKFHEL